MAFGPQMCRCFISPALSRRHNCVHDLSGKVCYGSYSLRPAQQKMALVDTVLVADLKTNTLNLPPNPLTVTIRIITCFVGNPYKPLFATATR